REYLHLHPFPTRRSSDLNVKSVVLRVNSPGGSAFASEQINREILALKAAGKPVVVSMGHLAASGGYWISMNADVIYADPSTITRSEEHTSELQSRENLVC